MIKIILWVLGTPLLIIILMLMVNDLFEQAELRKWKKKGYIIKKNIYAIPIKNINNIKTIKFERAGSSHNSSKTSRLTIFT